MKSLDIWGDDPWVPLGHCKGCDCPVTMDGHPKAPAPYCVSPICQCHEEFWDTTSGEIPELVQRWRHGDR